MIASLGRVGIEAGAIEGLTGVWSRGDRKIGSIGVHVSRGVTTHGFAINVNNDLQPFEWIVPCGIEDCRMTSLCREHSAEQDMDAFMDIASRVFGEVYGRKLVERGLTAWRAVLAGRPRQARRRMTRARGAGSRHALPGDPGGCARGRRAPVPRAQAAMAQGDGAGRAELPPAEERRSTPTTCTPSARRRTAPTSASAGSAARRRS